MKLTWPGVVAQSEGINLLSIPVDAFRTLIKDSTAKAKRTLGDFQPASPNDYQVCVLKITAALSRLRPHEDTPSCVLKRNRGELG